MIYTSSTQAYGFLIFAQQHSTRPALQFCFILILDRVVCFQRNCSTAPEAPVAHLFTAWGRVCVIWVKHGQVLNEFKLLWKNTQFTIMDGFSLSVGASFVSHTVSELHSHPCCCWNTEADNLFITELFTIIKNHEIMDTVSTGKGMERPQSWCLTCTKGYARSVFLRIDVTSFHFHPVRCPARPPVCRTFCILQIAYSNASSAYLVCCCQVQDK